MLANGVAGGSRTRASGGWQRRGKRAQEAGRHAPEPKDCLPPCCPDRHRGHRRVLVERRLVIDFVAGRRMVVTDDIEAKLAITEVLYRYCRALDRMDRDLMDPVWHPDGTADYGPTFQGSASGLLDLMSASHAKLLGQSPQVTNVLIEVDGDRAPTASSCTGTLWDLTETGAL